MKNFIQILKLGDESPEVLEVKIFLVSIGFNKTYFKDKNDKLYTSEINLANSYYSEVLAEVVNNFKAKIISLANELNVPDWIKENWKIEVDGAVDQNTWLIMQNYEKLLQHYAVEIKPDEIIVPEVKEESGTGEKFVSEFIAVAKREVGVHETGDSNTGKRVNEYHKAGSNGEVNGGTPWCFWFIQWVWLQVCKNLNVEYKDHYFGYTPDGVNWGKKQKICFGGKSGGGHVNAEDIRAGDLGFIYSASRNNACHIFLITGVNGNYVYTIEGNTNGAGSRDGGSVAIRKRPVSQVWAAVRIAKLYEGNII